MSLDRNHPKYVLYAVIVHEGASIASGHYVCFILLDGQWLLCSDEKIQVVGSKFVQSQQPYVLLYQQQVWLSINYMHHHRENIIFWKDDIITRFCVRYRRSLLINRFYVPFAFYFYDFVSYLAEFLIAEVRNFSEQLLKSFKSDEEWYSGRDSNEIIIKPGFCKKLKIFWIRYNYNFPM